MGKIDHDIFADLPPKKRSGNTKNFKVLLRWKGSLWDHVWKEYLAYVVAYFILGFIYRFALYGDTQDKFTKAVKYVRKQNAGLPLTFILGFYVNLVVNRWWNLYKTLPFPDELAYILRQIVPNEVKADTSGNEDEPKEDMEEPRKMRRTIVRYSILGYVLALRPHSASIQKKFPTHESMVSGGLVTQEELDKIEEDDQPAMYCSNWWVPFQWSVEIVARQVERGVIDMSRGHHHILGKLTGFKRSLQQAKTYYNICVPLVYQQVVSVAVYLYFLFELVGQQWILGPDGKHEKLDLYYPIFLSLRFVFFIGWLDTAQALSDPFGNDVEDFHLDDLIDRHLQTSMAIVDQTSTHPEVRGDDKCEFGGTRKVSEHRSVGASAAFSSLKKTKDDEKPVMDNESGDDDGQDGEDGGDGDGI